MAATPDVVRREVRLLELPLVDELRAAWAGGAPPDASGPAVRRLSVVGVETRDGTIGWGECSALNEVGYTDEWADGCFDTLTEWASGTPLPAGAPMAAAAVEMALLDVSLRTTGRSLADHLGVTVDAVPAGGTIGLASVADTLAATERLAALGIRRVKVKVDPERIGEVPEAVLASFPGVELHLDANGSLDGADMVELVGLAEQGVSAIEQPFPVERADWAAVLVRATESVGCVVMADEGVRSLADARRLADERALGGVVVKPPCLGGIARTLELLRWCDSSALAASAGGMLECGLGRHSLAAIAGLPGITMTGDLSPARRWLAADPWPDLELVDGSVSVPRAAGVAPPPDNGTLDELTVRRIERIG